MIPHIVLGYLRTQSKDGLLPHVCASDPTVHLAGSGMNGLQETNMSKERDTGTKEWQGAFVSGTKATKNS